MGYKTGQSRCLIEAADREWEMELPNPIPLTTLAPILQLRNISAGFRPNVIGGSENNTSSSSSSSSTLLETTSTPTSSSNPPTTLSSTTTKKIKVLGSGRNNKKSSENNSSSSSNDNNNNNNNNNNNIPSDITKILDSITFDIEQNTKIAIVGKNGCGKR